METIHKWTLNRYQCIKLKSNRQLVFCSKQYGNIFLRKSQLRKWKYIIQSIIQSPERIVRKRLGNGIQFNYNRPIISLKRHQRYFDFDPNDWEYYINVLHEDILHSHHEYHQRILANESCGASQSRVAPMVHHRW